MVELSLARVKNRNHDVNSDRLTYAMGQEAAIRIMDISISLAGLFLVLPFLIILVITILVVDGHPPLYRHRRLGLGGRHFNCLKLRSMIVGADRDIGPLLTHDALARSEFTRTHKLQDDPRATPLGRLLRRSALDELPQLFNVLKGEMSIVGPRPIVDEEAIRYGRHFQSYCSLKPGLTGMWQVTRHSNADYNRRVAADVIYRRRRSVTTNLRIMLATIPAVISGRGSY